MKTTHKPAPANSLTSREGKGRQNSFFSAAPGHRPEPFFEPAKVRTKLTVNEPGDQFERQADQVADRVVQQINSPVRADISGSNLAGQISRKPAFESDAEPEKPLQRAAKSAAPDVSPQTQQKIERSKGSGRSLAPDTLHKMENAMGADLSEVKIHEGAEASALNRDLNAEAFTHGNDIYFGQGNYNPHTSSGQHLLAHELTHTLQQRGGVAKKIQRVASTAAADAAKIDFDASMITLPLISLPGAKNRSDNSKLAPPLVYPKNYKRRDSYADVEGESSAAEQRTVWKRAVEGEVKDKVDAKVEKAKEKNAYDKDLDVYYLKHKDNANQLKLVGKPDIIAEHAEIPTWSKSGLASAFDVDHVKELQLGGANYSDNMELLHFSKNRAAGNSVKNEIEAKIQDFINDERDKGSNDYNDPKFPKNTDKAKKDFDITFLRTDFRNEPRASGNDHYWSFDQIKNGEHLGGFKPMTSREIERAKGSARNPLIYTSPAGGASLTRADIARFNGNYVKFSVPEFDEDQTGKQAGDKIGGFDVEFDLYGSGRENKKFHIPVLQMDGVLFGGSIPRRGQRGGGGLEQLLVGLELPGMSPITVDSADIVPGTGLVLRGRIHATLPVIEGVEIDFYITGNRIGISKTFSADEFNLPKPFEILSCSLTVYADTEGFGVNGLLAFDIENIGTGTIRGNAEANGKFGISGEFEFDKELFKGGATISVGYDSERLWRIEGELTIVKDQIKGIESGKINVTYENETLTAEGTAETTLKGVKEVTLGILFSKEVLEIEGGVTIDKLPGIKEGNGTLKIAKNATGEYDFSGHGTIVPDIPGISSSVDFQFENDIFNVHTDIAFERDRLSGTLTLGITNRAVDADGVPTGEALEDLNVYGGGRLSLFITEGVVVSAGVDILENGEIEVTGRIDLPSRFQIFPAPMPRFSRDIVPIPRIRVPLFPGVSAFADPYLTAEAAVEAGVLTNVFAEVKYNPAHPEEMSITGGADFEMPAWAQITAGVYIGVSGSILVASVEGGIDLSAGLRLSAQQPIIHTELKWTPMTGFELDGRVNAMLKPTLVFNGEFRITGSIGVWPLELSKTWNWPLGSLNVDPGVEFGMEFPFSHSKSNPFNMSFDNIVWRYPELNGRVLDNIKESVSRQLEEKIG